MSIQLDWPPHIVERLTTEAEKKGLSLGAYLELVIHHKGATVFALGDNERHRADEEAELFTNVEGPLFVGAPRSVERHRS